MEATIFAKKRTTRDGRPFYSYLARLTRNDGSTLTTAVKFREDAGKPEPMDCPVNIVFDKADANLVKSTYGDPETGEARESYTLWVSCWKPSENPYVDHSLDDF